MKKLLLLIVGIVMATTACAESKPGNPRVALETSMGTIVLELDGEKAPKTVANFLAYVDAEHYTDTIFHRVIKAFMIQGGNFTAEMTPKATKPPVQNEADNGLKNLRGTIAMARTNDPHSASSQFFINAKDNGFLDHTAKDTRGWGYCVFGKVVEGMDVVEKIEATATGTVKRFKDVPLEPIVIKSAKRL
jgi:peptidyl-prolyl cis-trans isomerase B (cyclophilin B)